MNKDLNTILKTPGDFLHFWLENYDSILEKKIKISLQNTIKTGSQTSILP